MKNENKSIYYGILFYFLYTQIYSIIVNVLTLPILCMQWNIHIIPILFSLVIVLLSVLFCRAKRFPRIKIWVVLLVVLFSVMLKLFNIPAKFYLSCSNPVYSIEEQSMITNYILICKTLNTIVLLAISYFKYLKIQQEEKFNGNINERTPISK